MAGGVDTFTQDITIFVLDVLQADGAKRGGRHNESEDGDQEVDDHVLVDRHEAVFLILEAVGRGRVGELKISQLVQVQSLKSHFSPSHKSSAQRRPSAE